MMMMNASNKIHTLKKDEEKSILFQSFIFVVIKLLSYKSLDV